MFFEWCSHVYRICQLANALSAGAEHLHASDGRERWCSRGWISSTQHGRNTLLLRWHWMCWQFRVQWHCRDQQWRRFKLFYGVELSDYIEGGGPHSPFLPCSLCSFAYPCSSLASQMPIPLRMPRGLPSAVSLSLSRMRGRVLLPPTQWRDSFPGQGAHQCGLHHLVAGTHNDFMDS